MSLNPPIFLKEKEENNSKFVEIQHSQTTSIAAEDPLQNLRLASQEVLQKAQQSGRSKCLKCGGSRMFYCYTCYVPVENVPIEQMPLVKLPLKIDIIKHPNETDGKSTAIHAKLLAPEFVNIYTYPCIPEYEEKDHEVALVFPGPKSVSIKDISFHLQKRIQNNVKDKNDDPDKPFIKRKKTEEQDLNDSKGQDTTLKKIIFIDSTWNQTNKIFTDERLQALDGLVCIPRMIRRQESYPVGFRQLPKSFLQAIVKNALQLEKKVYDTFWSLTYGLLQVELKTRKTCFWRHQKGKPDTFLSTIEAIYYFLVDYHTDILKEKYQGQYDNLLFFYSFMYQLIKNAKCSGDKETRKLIH